MPMQLDDKQRGTLLGVTAYLIWGFAALYWVQTEPVHAGDLLAHRAGPGKPGCSATCSRTAQHRAASES